MQILNIRSSTVHFHQRLLFSFPFFFSLSTTFFLSSNLNLSSIATPTFSVQISSGKENPHKSSTALFLQVRILIFGSVFPVWLPRKRRKWDRFFLINQTGGASFRVFIFRLIFGFKWSRLRICMSWVCCLLSRMVCRSVTV